MFASAEDRWERIAQGLLWTGALFLIFTAYGVYSGDDWRGLVMTAAPAVICLGLSYLARVRLDHLIGSTAHPLWQKITSGFLVGCAALTLVGLATGYLQLRVGPFSSQPPPPPPDPAAMFQGMAADLEVVEVETTLANGEKAKIKTLARKQPTSCPDQQELVEVDEVTPYGDHRTRRHCVPVSPIDGSP